MLTNENFKLALAGPGTYQNYQLKGIDASDIKSIEASWFNTTQDSNPVVQVQLLLTFTEEGFKKYMEINPDTKRMIEESC